MKVCGLSVDLIGIEGIIQKLIMLDVSLAIESTQEEPLAHATSCKATPSNLENVGRLRLKGRTSTMTHHLEHKA